VEELEYWSVAPKEYLWESNGVMNGGRMERIKRSDLKFQ
jgi:hypothetical protein